MNQIRRLQAASRDMKILCQGLGLDSYLDCSLLTTADFGTLFAVVSGGVLAIVPA